MFKYEVVLPEISISIRCTHKKTELIFEVFRWAGSNSSTFFGEDDDSSAHVSSSKVKDVIESFLEIFSED